MIEMLGDVVCNSHQHVEEMRRAGFHFSLKTGGGGLQWFVLKTSAMVSWVFGPQNQGRQFGDLGLKITATVSWCGPQNQVGGGLSICASKLMGG
jgi:hypothetical protein